MLQNISRMKMSSLYKLSLAFFLVVLIQACVEPYEFETEIFESALVVEGSISNQIKNHEVKLTRTFRFEENGPAAERNALVSVVDDQQREYPFEETTPGVYLSSEEFRAQQGREYQLRIITGDGREYESQPTEVTRDSQIEEITAVQTINDEGQNGIALRVNSGVVEGEAPYFRYEYEEDYLIKSPINAIYDFEIVDGDITLVPKKKEEYTCYGKEESIDINLVNTSILNQNQVNDHLVRFIPKDDPRIAHRYSLLVRQYVISQQAHAFYRTLKELSQSKSLFSQNQPGFLNGNISSVTNPDEAVIGYFEVASEISERIFFNFTDFYDQSEGGASFIKDCPITTPTYSELLSLIERDAVRYVERVSPDAPIFNVAPIYCVDCTQIGSNVMPKYWEE